MRDNRAKSRFELERDGQIAIAAYELRGDAIAFTHTAVPAELEGRGVGSAQVGGALNEVRRRGLKVVPLCSFVRAYIDRHPEQQDLLG